MQRSYRCLPDLVQGQAERNAAALAILAPGREPLTYGRLNRQVREVVESLNDLGIGRSDCVAMVLPEGPEMAVAAISIAAGATCAPLNPAYRASEFDFHLADLDCKALLVPSRSTSPAIAVAKTRGLPILELVPLAEEAGLFALHEPVAGSPSGCPKGGFAQQGDVALALHTSGSTARPKLALLSHKNICASADNFRSVVELTPTDRCLNVMPLFHIHGLSTIFASLAAGASVICPTGFTAEDFFKWIRDLHPTWYTAAPPIHQAVLKTASCHLEIVARSRLRFIRSASSAMPPQLIVDLERVFQAPFIEAYGMTEAAPQIASNRLPPSQRKVGSVGRAAGPEVAIMNEAGEVIAPGEVGEIVIRGANVMESYKNSEANESAFVRGWFRTGDLGYLDRDRYLFVTGRRKEIINRGGEKILPPEVDAILLDHPAVAQAAAFAIPHPSLGETVGAAVVLHSKASVTEAEICQFAAARLAPFKVPQSVVFVDEIPRGSFGKLERTRMAERLGLTGKPSDLTAPRTAIEKTLAEIWASVLGVDRPGIHADFFQSGGDSLTATQVLVRLRNEFRIELPIESVFAQPTIAGLGELVSQAISRRQGTSAPGKSRHKRGSGPLPLSFAQERLWFLDQLERNNAAYNVCASLWLSGPLSESTLAKCLDELRRRHEILRATFPLVGEQPVQIISQTWSAKLPVVDLTILPRPDREREALRLATVEAERPFDLTCGPLLRATLVRLSSEEHVLLLTAHHIISDGWSIGVLHRELRTLYKALQAGRDSTLPDLPIQYADFVSWQREWLQGDVLERQLTYWRNQLRGAPSVTELPADRPRPTLQTSRGSKRPLTISGQLMEKLKTLSLQEEVTLFMTVMAAFQTLLFRYTGQDDFIVGTPIANRTRLETEGLIGFFANTLAIRADLTGDPTFRELLSRVRTAAMGAYEHQDLPFEKLIVELQPERDPHRMPFVQIMFAFQNLPDEGVTPKGARETAVHPVDALMTGPPFELAAGLTARPFKVDSHTAKFDLTLYLWETEQELAGTWQYNADLFEAATIERIAKHFEVLLEAIADDPQRRLSEHRLEVQPNPSAPPLCVDRRFPQIFEEQAGCTPYAVAVECDEEHLTYCELNSRANQLARHLQKLGVRPGTMVGVSLTRSVEMAVALLGVLKSGGVYVPLDPAYPLERLAFMLKDARLQFLVTEGRLLSKLKPETEIALVSLDTDRKIIERESQENIEHGATAAELAYVIYTSGSTGQPKGVMVTHTNVCHYVRAMREAIGITPEDRYLHTASFSFSSSIRQFVVPLFCGAAVVVAPTDRIHDPTLLFDLIRRRHISIIDIVPSYWRTCVEELECLEPTARANLLNNDLRLILSASDRLTADLPKKWVSDFRHGARIINMYGQTETTGIVTIYPISGAESVIPIGRPIANTQLHVLDASRKPVPIGVLGELYVGGPGVAKGYFNQPDLTMQRFVPDPMGSTPGPLLYKTGDIVRHRADGNIEFVGRSDDQIKVRGFRIDPAEIEFALRQHPWVRESAVVKDATPTADQAQKLVAFVVPRRSSSLFGRLTKEVRAFLRRKLPEYMVPSTIVELDALPLTATGKVDRKALSTRFATGDGRGAKNGAPSVPLAVPESTAEKVLTTIWQDVLRLDSIGLDENFFDLGGDSLKSVQVIRRAKRAGLQLSLKELFQHQTVAELARAARATHDASDELERVADRGSKCGSNSQPCQGTRTAPNRTNGPQRAVRVTVESLRAYGQEALEKVGMPPEGAAIVTDVQLEASLRGQPTHNMDSIPRYARRISSGALNPLPQIRIERETPISAQVDGDNGPGQWVAVVAIETAIRKAKENGVAVVGVHRSNHLGAAGHYVWLAARQGLIGLCTTNGPVILAPTGGLTPTLGNNPLAVGIPAAHNHPILLDIAMSVAPRGKIGLQLAEGMPLPPGWILDRFGQPSTDPADLAAGLGVPIGGHKGYGLALVFEVLAGALTGAGFCWDHNRAQSHYSCKPRDLGHFFMVIDPALFGPPAEFMTRVDRMIEQTKSGKRAENVEEILIPGEMELRAREQNIQKGVPLRLSTYRALLKYGEQARLGTELVVIP